MFSASHAAKRHSLFAAAQFLRRFHLFFDPALPHLMLFRRLQQLLSGNHNASQNFHNRKPYQYT